MIGYHATLDHVQPLAPTTFVIFETGRRARCAVNPISIPIFVRKFSYIGAAFPTLDPRELCSRPDVDRCE